MKKEITISDFSPHLFWDVDLDQFDLDQYPGFMVQRVLEYGRVEDWSLLKKYYGDETIIKEATQLRSLNPISVSFLAKKYNIDEKTFRCYIEKPLVRNSLNL